MPYLPDRVPREAAPYLPHDPYESLDVDRVIAFVEGTSDEPNVRLALLAVLRAHSMNGAETPTAVFAIMVAALTMLASSMGALSALGGAVGWALGLSIVIGCAWFTKFAFAAHIGRMTCGVWLAAYEGRFALMICGSPVTLHFGLRHPPSGSALNTGPDTVSE